MNLMPQISPHLSSFISPRHGSNAWAQRRDILAAWQRGSQGEVRPMTLEYAPILACNADCYGCPYRRSRLHAGSGMVAPGAVALEDDIQAATPETAQRVLDAAYEGGVRGVLWTGGGEPTIWAPLLAMLAYSTQLGMLNALYTNGFVLGRDPDYAHHVLAPASGLVFVRMSINAVTPRVVKRHWGVEPDEVRLQLAGLVRLLEARNRLLPMYHEQRLRVPSIQISTIIDRQNVGDLLGICETVAAIFAHYREVQGDEDRCIVRPMTYHGRSRYSVRDHADEVIQQIIEVCGTAGRGRRALADAGVDLFMGFGLPLVEAGGVPTYSAVLESTYAERDVSLATGLFLIVGPNGAVYLSTEHNCSDDTWSFGNLKDQSVEEVYRSERRRQLLDYANVHRWGPDVAQPTSRTARLDRIAKAVSQRMLSAEDLEQIRQLSLASHVLILD